MDILYSAPARQRMVVRGISRSEVEAAIRSGSKSHQGDRILAAYHYFEVVYVVHGNRCFIITVNPRW